MMAGNPSWWSMVPPPSQQPSSVISPTPSFFPSHPYVQSLPLNSLPDHLSQDQLPHPQSWSQLLLGGITGDEDRYGLSHFHLPKKSENWEDQILNSTSRTPVVVDVKREENSNHLYGRGDEEFQQQSPMPTTWSQQQVMPVSSPRSCVTSISNSNMLDFSYNKAVDGKHQHADQSSECNSTATGGVCKKARVQPSQSQPPLKVRKEKLGDRITALHQLVSPFGKVKPMNPPLIFLNSQTDETDTASVLLEAIGYIRFLQGQIEALSSPYLGSSSSSSNIRDSDIQDSPKDLRSRGLCLVPVSCTQHVGSDNGADYWAPAIGGGF